MISPSKNYIVTQKYGETVTDSKGHTGIDLYQPTGTLVYAADGGDVMVAGQINNSYGNSAYGNCVMIDHRNGLYTFYAHLSKVNVKVGSSVIQGAVIGAVGSTGNSTGPHLHFEIRTNPTWNRNNFVDPETYVAFTSTTPLVDTGVEYVTPTIDFKAGDTATVTSSLLNMREQAGYNGNKIAQLNYNTQVEITGNVVEADGLQWYPVTLKGYLAAKEGDTLLLNKTE